MMLPRTALMRLLALALLAILPAGALGAQSRASADSSAIVSLLARFRDAAAAADSATMLGLLAPDAVILESGGAENVAEFRAHHLAADIEFARAVEETRAALRVVVSGDIAWAAGTSTARGKFRGRDVNSSGAELMVFTRTPQGWRIAAIHWSSRRRS
jgi:ketosteroid isomerase-like protein